LAHELRTPLAPIRNCVHILQVAGRDSDSAERVYEMMERQVDHMVRLVDDLMEVSRITRDKIELRKERVDLVALVKGAVETNKPLIDAPRHRLTVDVPAEPVWLDADPVRLNQVLANLLSNAAKYTPNEGRISLHLLREGEDAVLRVRDNGSGITADALPHVFELFMQAERTYDRAQGGLGIGLTLVKRLVTMHDGSVEAHSGGPDQGSEFVVRLPIASGLAETPATARPAAAAMKAHRILVVDDNEDAAESLALLLRILGAEVRTARDGESALAEFATFKPSVTLLDIGMPGMDGYEVTRRIRRLPGGADVTVIAQTGWGQEEDRLRSKEAGIDHHLIKPVDLSMLEKLLGSTPAKL
jgi:CheY-like chemotaxis protein/two-component sensor histidine kinase